jgi:GNAT superfamily N-acetyltransferase
MSAVVIRPARHDDHATLAQVWFQGSGPIDGGTPPPGLYDELLRRIPREIATGGWSVFAAEQQDRVVGLLAVHLTDSVLTELFVAEDRRSRGIGKAMLDHAKALMPGGFWLRTHTRNIRAHRFYEREGLVHSRTEPHPRHPEEIFRVYEWWPAGDSST